MFRNLPLATSLLLLSDDLSFLVRGTFDSSITTPLQAGLFLAVDNRNFSAFGTSSDIALYDDSDNSIEYGFNVGASGNLNIVENGSTVASAVKTLSLSTDYDLAIALDNNKIAHYFVYNSTRAAWERVWIGTFATSASLLYADKATTGATYTTNKEAFGRGMPYEAPTVDIASPQVNDGSVSGGDPALPSADFVMQFTLDTIPASSFIELETRYQDSSNYWSLRAFSSDVLQLVEVVGGGTTSRAVTGAILANGQVITVRTLDTIFTAFYNSTLAWTYASASNFKTKTDWKLNSLGSGGVISNLKCWRRLPIGTLAQSLAQAVA